MDTRILLIIALVGQLLCGVTDCLLSYGKSGRLNFKDIADADRMAVMFADMPQKLPLLSMVIGTFSITLMAFGYIGLRAYIEPSSQVRLCFSG